METSLESPARNATVESASRNAENTVSAPQNVRGWIRAALLLLFVLYVRAVGFAPVYDDNTISQWDGGWRDVPKFFTHDLFGSDGQAHSVYYRPLAQTWAFLIAWASGGAPGWLHLSAILVHLALVVLAFALGRKLFRDERLALLTALLFGLHPSKIESVAWIGSSFVDGFGGVVFFATLITFLNWREAAGRSVKPLARASSSAQWRAASVALFAAAMFTKETMVCIPVLLACWLWLCPSAVERGRTVGIRVWTICKALAPYAVVWAGYMAIRHRVIRPAGPAVAYLHPTYTFANLWTAPYAVWWYLRHLVAPWGLAVEYTTTVVEHPTLTGFVLPAAGLGALAVAAWAAWRRKRSAVAAFLGIWFVINLAPPVIVAPMVQQHDRYLYLSAYPFCALVAWAILRLGSLSSRWRMVLGLVVVALWSTIASHELGYWDSDATLWARVLQISPANIKAQVQMANLYFEAGDPSRSLAVLDDGLRSRPESPSLWMTRASVLEGTKRFDEARAAYLNVMRVTGGSPPGTRATLGAAAAYKLALLDISEKNFAEAERYARTALSLQPDGPGFHAALGQSLLGQGRMAEGKAEGALEIRLRLEQQRRMMARNRPQ